MFNCLELFNCLEVIVLTNKPTNKQSDATENIHLFMLCRWVNNSNSNNNAAIGRNKLVIKLCFHAFSCDCAVNLLL